MKRFLILIICLTLSAASADAFFWRGKGTRDLPAQQQTELARPYFEAAMEAERLGQTRRAMRAYERIYRRYPAAEFAAQSLFNYGVMQFERQRWRKSFDIFQTILIFHPSFPRFNDIIEYQFRIALGLSDGKGVRFLLVIPYRAHNRSVEYFEAVIRNAPYSNLAPLALMNIALIHQHRGNTIEAIDALDRMINLYPDSMLTDTAYLELARTFAGLVQGPEYDQGATREAISYFEDFLILFAESERVLEAEQGRDEMRDIYARSRLIIGEYYLRYRRWYRAAEIFLNETITIAPDSAAAVRARERLDFIAAIRAERELEQDPEDRAREDTFVRRILRVFTRS